MGVLLVFGLYLIVLGVATIRQREFCFTARPVTGRGALIAGQANIGAGVLVASGAALANPLPAIAVAVAVFCTGVCAAFVCQGARV